MRFFSTGTLFFSIVSIVSASASPVAAQDYEYEESSDSDSEEEYSYHDATPPEEESDEYQGPDRYWAFRFGGDLGFATIEHENYYAANLVGLLRIGPFRADIWAPLLFKTDGFEFRNESWDEKRDFNRLARCVRFDLGDYVTPSDVPDAVAGCEPWEWQTTHDRLYFSARVSPLEGVSLGHETLVSNFQNSQDLDRPSLGARSDGVLFDWAHAEYLMDSISHPHVVGGRLGVRPLQLFFGENWDETPDDMEAGFTAVSDLQAPLHLQTAFGRPLLDDNGDLRFTRQTISAVGADFHYLYIFNWEGVPNGEPRHGLFAFADYNRFLDIEDADGLHAGVRYVFKDPSTGWEVRTGGEYQYVGNRYMPTYFDQSYITRSQKFALTDDALELEGVTDQTTMLEYLQNLPGGHEHGFEAYFSALIPIPTSRSGPPTPLPLSAFVRGTSAEASWSVGATIGPFVMDQVIVLGQYLRRNFTGVKGVFQNEGAIVRLMARVNLGDPSRAGTAEGNFLDNVHIDASYDHRFFQSKEGSIEPTNDFQITMGFTTGMDG